MRSVIAGQLLVVLLCMANAASAEVVELNPVADTCITETYPDKNFGGMDYFTGGSNRHTNANFGLIKFNLLSAIPPGSKILSVSLAVEVTGQPEEPWNSANFGLHRLLRDWGEGDNDAYTPGGAAPAETNEANWTHRFAFTGETWGQPGGEAGVDYVSAPSTTTFVYQAGDPYTFDSAAALVADAQLWLDQPGTNFGWMLMVQNASEAFTARRFGSRESAFDAPRLSVQFQPPPPIERISVADGRVQLEFTLPAGFAHQVQFCDELQSGAWQSFPVLGPYSNETQIVFLTVMSGAQQFYRLKVH